MLIRSGKLVIDEIIWDEEDAEDNDIAFGNVEDLVFWAIETDYVNTVLLDMYEDETGKDPVPEEGGHTDDFEYWFVSSIETAWKQGVRSAEELKGYFDNGCKSVAKEMEISNITSGK